jgi:hypothetical protein
VIAHASIVCGRAVERMCCPASSRPHADAYAVSAVISQPLPGSYQRYWRSRAGWFRGVQRDAGLFAEPAFDKWLKDRKRPDLPPLRIGEPLAARIRRLQPFNRADPEDHPLRLLAVHTNLAKHRTPAVATIRLGAVYPDSPSTDITVAVPLELRPQPGHGKALGVGDVLASVPRGRRIELSIMPMVSLQRPRTGIWNIAVKELALLEEWVRTVAIPILITGSHQVDPLPPQLDIAAGHDDLRRALTDAGRVSAADRGSARIGAAVSRPNLVEILLHVDGNPGPEVLWTWVDSLDSTTVVECVTRLQRAAGDEATVTAACRDLIAEARQHAAGIRQRPTEGRRLS